MNIKINLPNEYISEKYEYLRLYDLSSRTTTGSISYTSSTSSITYNSTTGQEGMLTELQNALQDYMVSALDMNELSNEIGILSTNLGSETLDTTASTIKGAINEVNAKNVDLSPLQNQVNMLYRNQLQRDMLNAGLVKNNNGWSDTLEDINGINTGLSSNYAFDSTNKSLKALGNYTLDLCTGGTPISGGDNASFPNTNAYDNNTSVVWASSQTGTSVSGNAYIGYNFGSAKHIRRFTIQHGSNSNYSVNSVKLQNSTNGSSWTDVQTFTILTDSSKQTLDVNASTACQYWRLLANANPGSGNYWTVAEVEMMETTAGTTATIIWNMVTSDGTLTKAIIESIQNLGTGTITYYFSRDNGTTFTQCTLDTVTSITSQPSGTSIVLKVVITGNAELLAVAWGGLV